MLPIRLLLSAEILTLCGCSSVFSATDNIIVKCRNERRLRLLFDEFRSDTCARCYRYMPQYAFKVKFQYTNGQKGRLVDPRTNVTHHIDPFNADFVIVDTFVDASYADKWRQCCDAAWECCDFMSNSPQLKKNTTYCPRTWDGWQCWPDTLAGTIAKQPCQAHIYFENGPPSCTKFAYKECLPNGTWFTNTQSREWTNYSTCGRRQEHRSYLYFHVSTFIISVIFIIPALIIFFSYKQLQVPRITMHKNLLTSLFFNAMCSVLFKSFVAADELKKSELYDSIMDRNSSGCKFLFILTKYFRMSNYMWMFCEGFYLQKLIAATFAEQKNLLVYYFIGWALPILPVGVYTILRMYIGNEKCWAFPVETYEWIINIPNLLSLLVNLLFLCNIIRVLVTKLRATHAKEPSQYRKAVRATLVLIPLFGLNLCLIIYKPHSGRCGPMQAYKYFSYAMDGLQGAMVSLMFCYLNSEVLYLLRRTYQRYKLHHQLRSRKSSAIVRRWSTTMTSVNDSQNHNPHHKGKTGLKEPHPNHVEKNDFDI